MAVAALPLVALASRRRGVAVARHRRGEVVVQRVQPFKGSFAGTLKLTPRRP